MSSSRENNGHPGTSETGSRRYTVGVTGHRTLGTAPENERIQAECRRILRDIAARHPSVELYSMLATGADSLVAEAAQSFGIPIRAVVPFDGYDADFETDEDRERHARLLASAVSVERLPATERSDEAYLAGGQWIADHADLMIAVWDGKPAAGLGGTGDIVAHCRENDIPLRIIRIDRTAS